MSRPFVLSPVRSHLPPLLLAVILASCATPEAGRAPVGTKTAQTGPAASGTSKDGEPVHDAEITLRDTTLRFDAQGRFSRIERMTYRVLSADPNESWKTVAANFRPQLDQRPTLTARVVGPDGAVSELDPRTIVETPVKSSIPDVYSDERQLVAPLPGLRPGAIVDHTVETSELVPLTTYGVARLWNLGSWVRIERDVFAIEYPAALELQVELEHVPGKFKRSVHDGIVRLELVRTPLAALDGFESNQVPEDLDWPRVVMATGKSWNAVARGYGAAIAPRVTLTPELRSQVKTLVAGARTPQDKVARLLRWVRGTVRYTGVEIDDAALIPWLPADTVARQFGDCKDMSTLLVAMLREAGVDAKLALLSATSLPDVPEKLPGLGHFNHAIVYVPGPHLWVDPTDTFAAPGQLSAEVQGRRALVIDDTTTKLLQTPVAASAQNHTTVKAEFTLARFGHGRLVRIRETSGLAQRTRRQIAFQSSENYVKQMKDIGKDNYGCKGTVVVTHSEPLDFVAPFTETLELPDTTAANTDVDDAAGWLDAHAVIEALPFELDDPDDKRAKKDEDVESSRRKHAFLLPQAFTATYVAHVVPPRGFVARELPNGFERKVGPVTLSMKATKDASEVVTVTISFDSGPRRWSAEEFETVRHELSQALKDVPQVFFDNQALSLVKKGKLEDAVASVRALIKAEPNEAMHHVTLSEVLLQANLGVAARGEARRAVALAPKLAITHRTLGIVSLHDSIGQKLSKGYDRATAIAELKKALELEPEDETTMSQLLNAYVFDAEGRIYSPSANLAEAWPLFEQFRKAHGNRVDDYYAQSLFHGKKLRELVDLGPKLSLGEGGLAARLAATSIIQGADRAVALVEREVPEANRGAVVSQASTLMLTSRRYPEFAAMMNALVKNSGKRLTKQDEQWISLVRSLRPAESITISPSDPKSLIVGLFKAATSTDDHSVDQLLLPGTNPKVAEGFANGLRAGIQGQDKLPVETVVDIALAMLQVQREDRLPFGAEVLSITTPAMPQLQLRLVALQTPAGWRVHPATFDSSLYAEAVSQALGHHDEAQAIALIRSFISVRQKESSVEYLMRPLRLALSGGARLALVPALLNAVGLKPAEAVSPLEQALKAGDTIDPETRKAVALALASANETLGHWAELDRVATAMVKDRDLAELSPVLRALALRRQKHFTEAREVVEAALSARPDDERLLGLLASIAREEGRVDLAARAHLRLIDLDKEPALHLAELAFDSMYAKVDATSLERAEKARRIAGDNAVVLASLAALYAESGRIDDAHEVLSVRLKGAAEKDLANRSWFALGRMAQALKFDDAATHAYRHLHSDDGQPDPLERLVQGRLAALAGR